MKFTANGNANGFRIEEFLLNTRKGKARGGNAVKQKKANQKVAQFTTGSRILFLIKTTVGPELPKSQKVKVCIIVRFVGGGRMKKSVGRVEFCGPESRFLCVCTSDAAEQNVGGERESPLTRGVGK